MIAGLHFSAKELSYASGISLKTILKDIDNKELHAKDGYEIWYRDAVQYVYAKWNEGTVEMYPPYDDSSIDSNIAMRLLSQLDDRVAKK